MVAVRKGGKVKFLGGKAVTGVPWGVEPRLKCI